MLNAYALQNGGLVRVPAAAGAVPPPEALWIDLFEPTPEEERLIETTLRIAVPTREEMREIAAVLHLVLSHTQAAAGANGPSPAKFTTDPKAQSEAQARVAELLTRYPLYPEIALE